jgi:hypothetical protein
MQIWMQIWIFANKNERWIPIAWFSVLSIFSALVPSAALCVFEMWWEPLYSYILYSLYSIMKPEPEFLNILWRLKSQLFKASCLFKGQSVHQGLQLFVLLLNTILCIQFFLTVNIKITVDKMIYICIWYWKYSQTYLGTGTLHSHFQLNCHFKMFKNSGSEHTVQGLY